MSLDKFGRGNINSKKNEVIRGPPGTGFKLTSNGDYNVDGKLLSNVKNAMNNGDAVNLGTLSGKLRVCMKVHKTKRKWDGQLLSIGGIGEPVEGKDAVTKQYLDMKVPKQDKSSWYFDNKRLTMIGEPAKADDAVNKDYLDRRLTDYTSTLLSTFPSSQSDNSFDMKNRRLSYVGDPESLLEAVNVNYLVRAFGEILFQMYTDQLPPFTIVHPNDKNDWIRRNVIERYFIDPRTRLMRTHLQM